MKNEIPACTISHPFVLSNHSHTNHIGLWKNNPRYSVYNHSHKHNTLYHRKLVPINVTNSGFKNTEIVLRQKWYYTYRLGVHWQYTSNISPKSPLNFKKCC